MDKIKYLFELTDIHGNLIATGPRKTFLLGLAVAVKSMFSLAREILKPDSYYSYLLTYHFSQDFLELFFACIRLRLGCNNNPNILQLKSAMKTLILKNYIKTSKNGNCQAFGSEEFGCLLDVKWNRNKKLTFKNSNTPEIPEMVIFGNKSLLSENNYHLKENILYYISGFVVRSIQQFIDCRFCVEALCEEFSVHNYAARARHTHLVSIKNRGGLIRASDSVFKIVKATENCISVLTKNVENLKQPNINLTVMKSIQKTFINKSNIFSNCHKCEVNLTEISHKLNLIKLICNKYLKIRLPTYARFHSQEFLNPVTKRQILNKFVLYNNM